MLFAGEYTLAHAKGEFGVPKAGAAVVDSPMGCPNQLTEVRHRWGRQTENANSGKHSRKSTKQPETDKCVYSDGSMHAFRISSHARRLQVSSRDTCFAMRCLHQHTAWPALQTWNEVSWQLPIVTNKLTEEFAVSTNGHEKCLATAEVRACGC